MGYDYRRKLAAANVSTDDLGDLVLWSVSFTDAQLVAGLELPAEARDLPPALWRFLAHYPLPGARSYRNGASDTRFYDTAYLATHIAYIPTGYGRYSIYVEDAPSLYRFLRENFYAVLEMGELDLVAEFVDLFRQYGCTEQDDLQVRDGTRYLLKLFHGAGDRWMAYREPYEGGQDRRLRRRAQSMDRNLGSSRSGSGTGGARNLWRHHPRVVGLSALSLGYPSAIRPHISDRTVSDGILTFPSTTKGVPPASGVSTDTPQMNWWSAVTKSVEWLGAMDRCAGALVSISVDQP